MPAEIDETGVLRLLADGCGIDGRQPLRQCRAPPAGVDDQIGGDLLPGFEPDPGDVRDTVPIRWPCPQRLHGGTPTHRDPLGFLAHPAGDRLDHRPPAREHGEALVIGTGSALHLIGNVGHRVVVDGAGRGEGLDQPG